MTTTTADALRQSVQNPNAFGAFFGAIEVALLAAIVYHAWTWPKETSPTSMTG